MKKCIFIIISSILFINFNPVKSKTVTAIENKIEVVKFMYNSTYAIPITKPRFWIATEEHARMDIMTNDPDGFSQRIQKLGKSKPSDWFLKYAFLLKKNGKIDTIYSDIELRTWTIIKNGKSNYYYDKDGSLAEDLGHSYGFFKSCW